MKKVVLALCFLTLLCGYADAQEHVAQDTTKNINGAHITFVNNDTTYDFGGIPGNNTIDYKFEIKNTGTVPLSISAITCESANVKCKWPGKPLKPGKKGLIILSYTAAGDIGSFENDLTVASNATESPTLIHISGAIIPAGSDYTPSAKPSTGGGHGHHAH